MNLNRRYLLAFLALALPGLAFADDDDDDADDAYEALRAGNILSLREILAKVEEDHPGEIIGVEFEWDDGVPVYELKLLTPAGHFKELHVDARNGVVLDQEND